MNEAIHHRGPDEDGFYFNDGVGLAMRRLAIIDLKSGQQPIPNADRTAWIVFNGISNAIGQFWWTRALYLAPASAVAPFYYLSLVWASILGFAVWGELPSIGLIGGSAIVVG